MEAAVVRYGSHWGAADASHGAGAAILLVVGMKDEQGVHRLLEHRLRHAVERHLQKASGV